MTSTLLQYTLAQGGTRLYPKVDETLCPGASASLSLVGGACALRP
jgi:hypothetical protein